MGFFTKWFWLLAGAFFGLPLAILGWYWIVERVEVPSGKFVVLVHRWGNDLPENVMLAPDESYKGVMLKVLPEGRWFVNPLFWGYELRDLVTVPPGTCLVLCRKYGKDLPKERLAEGLFLVGSQEDGQEEKGILREVLRPGSYRINPYAYSWKSVPAVEVGTDQVGVRTLKVGKDPTELKDKVELGKGLYVVPDGYRGVQTTPLPNGTYYINPSVEHITPVNVRSHTVEFTDIVFPSRDGFMLRPRVVVEYAVRPEKAPEVLVRLSDDHGLLNQEDADEEQKGRNQILQKVILPHIRGYVRIEGSNFDAKDFIITTPATGDQKASNNREKFRTALEEKVRPRCLELGVVVKSVALADLKPPDELTQLISERVQALVEQEKNKARLVEYKTEQELRAKEALKPRSEQKTKAETRLKEEETRALQRKEVEEQRLTQELKNAQLQLDAARDEAKATLARGKAEAGIITVQNEAEVAGLKKAVQGFNGVQNFAQFHVLSRLAPALTEIFASDDSEFAKLLTAYLSPPAAAMNKPQAGAGANGNDKVGVPEAPRP